MAELKRSLLFSIFADSGTQNAWGPTNSNPAFPAEYTLKGAPARVSQDAFRNFNPSTSGVNIILLDDTVLTSETISAEGFFSTVGSSSQGFVLANPSTGNGYQILINSTNARIFAMTNWAISGSALRTIDYSVPSNHYGVFRRNNSNGDMEFWSGVSPDSLTQRGTTFSQANANTDWRAGVFVRDSGRMESLVSAYTPAQSVTSINNGNPIAAGQTGVPFETTGFSGGAVTSITSNQPGVTISNIVLSGANDGKGTFDISGFSEEGLYPSLPANVEYTFANGAATAKISQSLTIPQAYSQVTYANASALNSRVFAWHLLSAGISIANGTRIIWLDTPDFAFLDNGDTTSTAGTVMIVTAWARNEATGKMSEWIVTIGDAGVA
jgi:hypothetical protein